PNAWESAAASVYLRHFPEAALAEQKQELLSTLGRSYAPSLVGLPAQPNGIYQAVFQLVSSSNLLFKPPQFRVRSEVGPYFPDLEEAHHELRFLYGQFNYLDRALEHQKEELRLTRQAGRRPGESAEEFANRLEYLDKDTAKLVELVRDGREKYAAASRSLQGE